MKLFSLLSPSAPSLRLFCVILYAATPLVRAIVFKKVPSPNLNLANLGRTVFTGDFTGISLYEFEGHSEDTFDKNGSQSLLQRIPDGRFANVASSDSGIQAMCLLKMSGGNFSGVVVGGDFTVLGGVKSPGAALFDPDTGVVKPLTGLSGQVSALYCDQSTNTVYAGGTFISANSTNAIKFVANEGWRDLPFQGFNGPVNSITKASNGNIIFGGSFTGLGNVTEPIPQDQIQINLVDAEKLAGSSTPVPEFSDPANIICKTTGKDGPGDTWLLADRTPGFWRADFGYTFQPTRLRLWNTHLGGRGTKTFRFTAFPINGIMNLTYVDPLNNQTNFCTSECPLSRESDQPYQDFHFVNVIGMNGFQIDISDWYGDGGGLTGIELSQNDINSYAVGAFNEPSCTKTLSASSTVTTTGPWSISPSAQSSAEYLSVTSSLTASSESNISLIFLPNIRQSGNYSVNIYTPGCVQDNSCQRRGRIKITGIMSKEGTKEAGFSTEIFQTNNFDKYDQIYFGFVAASSDEFRPSVTITIASGQVNENLTIVAQRVGFTLISQSGGLNGLFEYDPSQIETKIANFDNSPFYSIGKRFPAGSEVNDLQTSANMTFIGGNFTSQEFSNILKISDGNPQSLANNGLNGAVETTLVSGTTLYAGGTFSNTAINGSLELANVASYDTLSNTWNKLGGGVNGAVCALVALQINITKNEPETTIALTGKFTEVLGFGNNPPFPATGFAIWVPSVNNWFQNLDDPKLKIDGSLTTAIDLLDGTSLFAGSISSSQLSADDVAEINSSGNSLTPLPIQLQHPLDLRRSVQTTKDPNPSEIVTGLFYARDSHNIVILGGHFSAAGSDGSEVNNLALVDSSNGNSVTGVGPLLSKESKILAMSVHEDTLFAGGFLTGTVNEVNIGGLISYNLLTSTFDTQPPSLDGDVFSIQSRQLANEIYVGGNFTSAGSLSCPAVCQYSISNSQWNRPGNGLAGVANTMIWASSSLLAVGGNLELNDVATSLVTFDTKSLNWSTVIGSNVIPGPVSSIAKANNDGSHLWVAGYAQNGTAFLMKSNGNSWTPISHLLGPGTQVKGLQVLSLIDNHASSDIVPSNSILLVIGALNLPAFGEVSAALFNGTSFQPYIITNSFNGGPGSLSKFFAEKEITFQSEDGKLAKVFVILISLAIALGLIMIIIIAGLLVERSRNKEEDYSPAPTSILERGNAIASRVPPDQLFGSINQGGRKAIEKQATLI